MDNKNHMHAASFFLFGAKRSYVVEVIICTNVLRNTIKRRKSSKEEVRFVLPNPLYP